MNNRNINLAMFFKNFLTYYEALIRARGDVA